MSKNKDQKKETKKKPAKSVKKKKPAGKTPARLKLLQISALAGEGLEKLKLELRKSLP